MSDLENRNAEAMLQALEDFEKRIGKLEADNLALRNEVQSQTQMMIQLQQSNTLALQRLVGTGATAHGDDR